jgi:hypothetical protein
MNRKATAKTIYIQTNIMRFDRSEETYDQNGMARSPSYRPRRIIHRRPSQAAAIPLARHYYWQVGRCGVFLQWDHRSFDERRPTATNTTSSQCSVGGEGRRSTADRIDNNGIPSFHRGRVLGGSTTPVDRSIHHFCARAGHFFGASFLDYRLTNMHFCSCFDRLICCVGVCCNSTPERTIPCRPSAADHHHWCIRSPQGRY